MSVALSAPTHLSAENRLYYGAWKYALEQFFAPFLALFFPKAHAAIDWNQPITFRDTELQQIAPEDQAGKQRADKLVQVQRRDGQAAWVLVHVEIQSQRDGDFAKRMFRYHARLFDRDRIPVVSLAVLGDDDPNWYPDHFGYDLWDCELLLRFPTVTSFEEIGREAGLAEGLALGRIEGRAEGLAAGELKGQRTLVVRLPEHKVGALSEEIQTQIMVLTAEQLLRLSAALLDFTSVADITTWLAQQATPPGAEPSDD